MRDSKIGSVAGWFVCRADNGRYLGWLSAATGDNGQSLWAAHISESAFRHRPR